MHENEFARKVITGILQNRDWSERKLAKLARMSATMISRHVSGERRITADYLIKYLDTLSRHESSQLLHAWLRDRVGTRRADELVKVAGGEISLELGPNLDREKEEVILWWIQETATDGELAVLFLEISKRFGFKSKTTERKRR